METLAQDIRYAYRTLVNRPGFTLTATISLGLGIGAISTIFTLVTAVLLHGHPMEDPDRVVAIYATEEKQPGLLPISYPNYLDLRRSNEVLTDLAAFRVLRLNFFFGDQPERLIGEVVSANYFAVFGVRPLAGRVFGPEDFSTPGGNPVAILTYRFWDVRFGKDLGILGQDVLLNGRKYTIVGITPKNFKGINTIALNGPDIFIPMTMFETVSPLGRNVEDRSFRMLDMVGRLRPGVTPRQALVELRSVAKHLEREYPDANKAQSVDLRPLTQALIFPQQREIYVKVAFLLSAVAGLLLLIACSNVASLLLTRGLERQREIAIRLALGARRSRLARQFLTESAVLALLGGGLGLLIAFWGPQLLWSFRPPFLMTTTVELEVDGRVLLFTLAVSLLTGLLFGVAPALQALRADMVPALKQETAVARQHGARIPLRSLLIVVQVALSLLALSGAGLFLRSLRQAQQIDPGFETARLINLRINLAAQNYAEEQGRGFYRQVLARLESLPGVRSATLAMNLPLNRGAIFRRVVVPGTETPDDARPYTRTNTVGPRFFETTGIRLLEGRGFDSRDRREGPLVAVVNQTMAQALWPGRSAVGQRFRTPEEEQEFEVIGVAADSKYVTLGEPPEPLFYMFIEQLYAPEVLIHVRTQGTAQALLQTVRREVQRHDRTLPLANVETMEEVIRAALWTPRMGAALLALFGLLSLMLASIGIYGVMTYSVRQRRREVGIRIALGAREWDVLGLILRQVAAIVGCGLALGLLGAVAGARLLQSLLYGTAPTHVGTLAATALLLAGVALLASFFAARRNLEPDPAIVLRAS